MQLHIKKSSNPVKKLAEELSKHFSKEEMQMSNRHMKRCLIPLITEKMQIKIMIHKLKQVRMAIIKKHINNKCW